MKIALLGATGFVGRAAARELAAVPDVGELLLVDYRIREAKKFARSLSPRCRWAMADVGREPDLARLLGGVDAVASAVGPGDEYEKKVLATCAAAGLPAASVGDGPLGEADRREVHDAFRRAGVPAVAGCGLMPGWTELLAARFGRPGRGPGGGAVVRYLFFAPDRFGGYAFFRRIMKDPGRPAPLPPGAPPGAWRERRDGDLIGWPPGRPGKAVGRLGRLEAAGDAGREFAAALLFWTRGRLRADGECPAAAAGLFLGVPGESPAAIASVVDRDGRLPGVLLARAALLLAGIRGKEKGLLSLPDLVDRAEADRIAASCGAQVAAP